MNPGLDHGVVGVCPSGALGNSVLNYLSCGFQNPEKAVFLDRPGSQRPETKVLHCKAKVRNPQDNSLIVVEKHLQGEALSHYYRPGMFSDLWKKEKLPGIIFVVVNPDQLTDFFKALVKFLETVHAVDGPLTPAKISQHFPVIALMSNGVYYNIEVSSFGSFLGDSAALGKIPPLISTENSLTGTVIGSIFSKIVRAPTMLNGLRLGSGDSAIYVPGAPGMTTLAGGSMNSKRKIFQLFEAVELPVEIATDTNPMATELRKAHVNLSVNLLGVLASIKWDGSYEPSTIGQTMDAENLQEDWINLAKAIVAIGKLAGIDEYMATTPEKALAALRLKLQAFKQHFPSSVELVKERINDGSLKPELPPTEAWILHPLLHYATIAGFSDVADTFAGLENSLVDALSSVCSKRLGRFQPVDNDLPSPYLTRARAYKGGIVSKKPLSLVGFPGKTRNELSFSLRLQRDILVLTTCMLIITGSYFIWRSEKS